MAISKELVEKCLALPAIDRVALVETLGATLQDPDDEFPIPTWHLIELERQIRDDERHPERTIPWETVRKDLLRKVNAHRTKAARKGRR